MPGSFRERPRVDGQRPEHRPSAAQCDGPAAARFSIGLNAFPLFLQHLELYAFLDNVRLRLIGCLGQLRKGGTDGWMQFERNLLP